jgi:ketosteroid isomerase-like protein
VNQIVNQIVNRIVNRIVNHRNLIVSSSLVACLASTLVFATGEVAIASPQSKPIAAQSTATGMDKSAIIDIVNKIGIMADLREWQAARSAFADQVVFDYTAIFGGQANMISADTQMQQWDAFFKSTFKTTQHLIGSHVVTVTGDRAVSQSHFQAHHTYLNSQKKDWILAGTYTHELVRTQDGWKVTKMVATKLWEVGDRPM